MDHEDELLLCYVEGSFAWFTSHFHEEWGDDWDDAPYEHNAGPPYGYHHSKTGDVVNHYVTKVAFDGPFDQPCSDHVNSHYSVATINAGAVGWLTVWPPRPGGSLFGGASLGAFIEFVEAAGGNVYLKRQQT